MEDSSELKVISVKEIELAAAITDEGFCPALFDAGGQSQTFWFIDKPEIHTFLERIESKELVVEPTSHKETIRKLEQFIQDSIVINSQDDTELEAA